MFAFGEGQNSVEGYLEIYPEDMIDDIYISLKSCDTCQRANDANFSILFSPVESKAWNQVELQSHIFCVCVMQPRIYYYFKVRRLNMHFRVYCPWGTI